MSESHRRKFVAGSLITAEYADRSITAVKQALTLATGFHNLDITTAKLISGNAIGNLTEGMLPDGNSAPLLARVNGATDKALRISWVANGVVEIQFAPWAKPPDLDEASTLTVNLLMAKDANTDTAAVVGVAIFDGVGDTNAGGNTAALAVATLAKYSVTMAAADLAGPPGMLNISITPGTHANDAVYLYAAWIEYARV